MNDILYNITSTFGLAVKIALFALPLWGAILMILPKSFSQALLSENFDGARMFFLGLILLILSTFAINGVWQTALATFATGWMALGLIIWLPDYYTNKLFAINHNITAVTLLILAGLAYFFGLGGKSLAFIGFNEYSFMHLMFWVALVSLVGSLGVFSLLSEGFKQRILPQDGNGMTLMIIAAMIFFPGAFVANPILSVVLASTGITVCMLGFLIWLEKSWTEKLISTKLAFVYWPVTVAGFFLATYLL